uniref:Claudin n=1 Tax=Oncorhynchus mykiss TaxID=8022 RepID=A0A8L0DSD6_ONCMY
MFFFILKCYFHYCGKTNSSSLSAIIMKHRTVIMYMEIGCFVSEYWTWSEVGSVVLTTSNYFSNLWKDCVSDSTEVSDCKEYPSMLGLPVRALSICSVILGFFAGVLTLIGLKCTKIGGSELANARVTFAGGITYLASGKICLWTAVFIGWGGSLLLITGGFVLSFFSGKEGLRSTKGPADLTPMPQLGPDAHT